jgi:hypothetical protein
MLFSDSFFTLFHNKNKQQRTILKMNPNRKNYHFSQRYTEELLKRIQTNSGFSNNTTNREDRETIEAQERELHNSKYYETFYLYLSVRKIRFFQTFQLKV